MEPLIQKQKPQGTSKEVTVNVLSFNSLVIAEYFKMPLENSISCDYSVKKQLICIFCREATESWKGI